MRERRMSDVGVRGGRRRFPVGVSPTRSMLQPEATGFGPWAAASPPFEPTGTRCSVSLVLQAGKAASLPTARKTFL
jgi:hypothetical protein